MSGERRRRVPCTVGLVLGVAATVGARGGRGVTWGDVHGQTRSITQRKTAITALISGATEGTRTGAAKLR
jgi:hypothetical protein